jgi:hypothetical protein
VVAKQTAQVKIKSNTPQTTCNAQEQIRTYTHSNQQKRSKTKENNQTHKDTKRKRWQNPYKCCKLTKQA